MGVRGRNDGGGGGGGVERDGVRRYVLTIQITAPSGTRPRLEEKLLPQQRLIGPGLFEAFPQLSSLFLGDVFCLCRGVAEVLAEYLGCGLVQVRGEEKDNELHSNGVSPWGGGASSIWLLTGHRGWIMFKLCGLKVIWEVVEEGGFFSCVKPPLHGHSCFGEMCTTLELCFTSRSFPLNFEYNEVDKELVLRGRTSTEGIKVSQRLISCPS